MKPSDVPRRFKVASAINEGWAGFIYAMYENGITVFDGA